MFTFAKTNGHFTRCFEGQVHQVLYLCSEEPRGTSGIFPAMDRVLYHIGVRTLYARGIFREQLKIKFKPATNPGNRNIEDISDFRKVIVSIYY